MKKNEHNAAKNGPIRLSVVLDTINRLPPLSAHRSRPNGSALCFK